MGPPRKPLFDPDEPTATDGPALAASEPEAEPPLTAPPEADVVASRALMVAALLERARLESTHDEDRHLALQAWVDQHSLFGNLGADGVELFEGKLGSWSDEDIEAVDWTSEELALLLWALKCRALPAFDARMEAAAVLQTVPLLGAAESFIDDAKLRPTDELEVHRALCDTLLEALRSEVYARSIQEAPETFESDEELEELLASVESDGFDRATAAQKGPAHEAVQGLRHWSRSLLKDLSTSGSPHLGPTPDAATLVSLDDATLATWLGIAHMRTEAMAWLLEGDEYELEDGLEEA